MSRTDGQPAGASETPVRKTGGEILTQSVKEYIETHFREKYSLQTMAGGLYVNGSYLLRVFKKHTGTTPLAYHNQVRCRQAGELLIHSDKSISEIGEAVGFVSSAHFSHVFKKEEKCTPSEYRIRNRLPDSREPDSREDSLLPGSGE